MCVVCAGVVMTTATLERPTTFERPTTPDTRTKRLAIPTLPTLIFIYGVAGVGKDTVAERLVDKHDFVSLALADPIRDEYRRWFGTSDYRAHRQRLIDIGEGYKRIYGQDVWCDQGALSAKALNECGSDRIVITDVRYQHEYDYFVKRGWVPVHVTALEYIRLERLAKRDGNVDITTLRFEASNFVSDANPAYVLRNNDSIAQLHGAVDEMVALLV